MYIRWNWKYLSWLRLKINKKVRLGWDEAIHTKKMTEHIK